eukprot:Opistho-1_new@75802
MGDAPAAPQGRVKVDLKVIFLGSSGAGKTCLIQRYINDQFSNTMSTIGASFALKSWRGYKLGLWVGLTDRLGRLLFAIHVELLSTVRDSSRLRSYCALCAGHCGPRKVFLTLGVLLPRRRRCDFRVRCVGPDFLC